MNNKFQLSVYNTFTRKIEEIEVTEEIYKVYKRTGWNIKDNNSSFYNHEIQFSGLIGGNDEGYENFDEFICNEEDPLYKVVNNTTLQSMRKVFKSLEAGEQKIILEIFINKKSEREYAKV